MAPCAAAELMPLAGANIMRPLLLTSFILVIASICTAETGRVCVSSAGNAQGKESSLNPASGSRKYTVQIDNGAIY
jgi:hypothetical protein